MVRGHKVAGWALISWWLILLIAAGLAANAFLAFRFFEAGAIAPGLLFCAFFVGVCAYLWRTYHVRAELRSLLRD